MRAILLLLSMLVACGSYVEAAPPPPSHAPVQPQPLPVPYFSPSFPVDQTFPITLASAQIPFPSLTRLKAWTFNEPSGNIIEQVAGGPTLNPSGAVHYAMWTPLANGKKHAGVYSVSDYFTTSAASAFDPAGASFTWMAWIRPEFVYNTSGYIVDALDDGGHGFQLWMEKGFGAATGQLKAIVKDGTTTLAPVSTQTGYQYGNWLLVAVSYDSATKTAHLLTPEEDATSTNAAFVNASLVNTQTSTLNGVRAHNTPLDLGFAYVAFAAGKVTLAQVQAYAAPYYGNGTGLAATSPAQAQVATYDTRDPVFGTRAITWGRAQVPREWSTNKVSWATGHAGSNSYASSERMATWTVVGAPTVTAFAIEAPNGSFAGTKIEKTGAGTAVGVHQSAAVFVTAATASVFLRADSGHTATIRLVGALQNAFDTSTTINVTTAWQQFSIAKTGLDGGGATAFDFYVYPTDSSNNASTGYVYAWGGQLGGAGQPYAASNSVAGVQGGPSIIGGTATWGKTSSGWVELVVSPGSSTGETPLFSSTMNGDGAHGAGVDVRYSASLGFLRSTLYLYPSGAALSLPWDIRNVFQSARRLHQVTTWGQQDVDNCVNGACQNYYPNGQPQALPLFPAAPFVLGYDPTVPGNGVATLNFERIAVGPGLLNRHQVRGMAAAAGASPKYRILALGDSITGFQNAYHAQLAADLGANALVVNQGLSGDRSDMMQARLQLLLADGSGGGWTHAIVLGGINDMMFFAHTPDYTMAHLQAMYTQIHALGIKVIAQTIWPCAGSLAANGGGWGTACSVAVQGYVRTINTWLKTQATDVDLVVDTNGFLTDTNGGDPDHADRITPSLTYDGLHPNAAGSDAVGNFIFTAAFGGVALAWLDDLLDGAARRAVRLYNWMVS